MFEMLTQREKKKMLKKDDLVSDDNVQSLRSWIRKIEQSTMSVSSRLSAVEKRLSGRALLSDDGAVDVMEGPVEKLVSTVKQGKKKNAGELARVVDSELSLLQNELIQQEAELKTLKDALVTSEEVFKSMRGEVQLLQTSFSQVVSTVNRRMERLEQREPFVMRFGSMEIPIEITGVIGGIIAFLVAFLVALNEKEILLSPAFLSFVGVLLIGSAMIKMVRIRSRRAVRSYYTLPLETPTVPLKSLQYKEEG
jgi:preprotein translocase subunit SecD